MPAESTTNTRNPSPSGTSASTGTVMAPGWTPVTMRPNTDSPIRSTRVARPTRARTATARDAESTATATLTTVAVPSGSVREPSPALKESVSPA